MGSVLRGMVQGIGITNYNDLPISPRYFTELCIAETVVLPEQKPDMEQLISVMVDAKVISTRLVDTPVSISQEGQNLTGKKLIVEVKLKQKITYIADELTQGVHAAHFEKSINSIFIVIPKCIDNKSIETLFRQKKLVVTPYIEDIYGVQRDKRTIYKNITLLVDVTAKD